MARPPYPDFTEIVRNEDFHGVCWVPTTILRWIERQDYPDQQKYKVLQQYWETHVVNNSGTLSQIHDPGYTQWRDVPTVASEDETLLPGEVVEDQVRPG